LPFLSAQQWEAEVEAGATERAVARRLAQSTSAPDSYTEAVIARASVDFEYLEIDWYSFLERPRLRFPMRELEGTLRDASVLVTGAGGSIGSELSLKLASLGVQRLVLLESSEQALYRLQSTLDSTNATPHIILGSVNDTTLLDEIFARHRPTLVFHAAAHKHVALLEEQPLAAVANNALGTLALCECAQRHGVARVVMLSTDKAVAPSSILGAAKRIAEQITLASGGVVTRLANVLGTSGSVVETFCRQISAGGPITITDRHAERYFLTCEEAVDMLVYAAVSGDSRGLLAPRLPRAHSVMSLAQFLSTAFAAEAEVPFALTGLRPGDKLHEALWSEDESPIDNDGGDCIELLATPIDTALMQHNLPALKEAVQARDLARAIAIVRQLVPDYSPSAKVSALVEQSFCVTARA
jgi:FlaA1/EpsC-like NDP-sugar epimerase